MVEMANSLCLAGGGFDDPPGLILGSEAGDDGLGVASEGEHRVLVERMAESVEMDVDAKEASVRLPEPLVRVFSYEGGLALPKAGVVLAASRRRYLRQVSRGRVELALIVDVGRPVGRGVGIDGALIPRARCPRPPNPPCVLP